MNSDEPGFARWLREPLLHFTLLGLLLFVVHGLLRGDDTAAPREIVVSASRAQSLATSFSSTWMRPPTPQEMQGLIDDYVAEEIYYREAIAMGLDRDDTVIRRRLRQKMEFISEDAATTAEPKNGELQAYLAAHRERFVTPADFSFVQVFFSTEKRGDGATLAAGKLLAELKAGRGPANLADAGDVTLLPGELRSASPQAVASTFGTEFVDHLQEAPVGQWSGPLQSSFGLHLVRVYERREGELPALQTIRPQVLREWQAEQRTLANKRFLDELRSKYDIRVEAGAPAAAQGKSGANAAGAP